MPLEIVRNDITKMQVDAIVNTANPRPIVGGGVDRAIHQVAGAELLAARKKIGSIAPGEAAITSAYHLPAEYVIHTVGPVWQDGKHNVDRKHFSKIRNNPAYQPSKSTALAFAVALELNLDETKDFIGRAGYAISHYNGHKNSCLSVNLNLARSFPIERTVIPSIELVIKPRRGG